MSNPVINQWTFANIWIDENSSMTLDWVINKSFILLILTISSAFFVWNNSEMFIPYILPIGIISFLIALVIIFLKKTSTYLSFVYTILEWLIIWVISFIYEKEFPWIVIHAVLLTFWAFLVMLFLYKSRLITASEKFKNWVLIATGSISFVYVWTFIWILTWWFKIPYIHESWLIWILFSIFVVWIASLNLILDFENIETWIKNKAPKYMEWYASFWLLVTLIWLYLEILKLLSKFRKK